MIKHQSNTNSVCTLQAKGFKKKKKNLGVNIDNGVVGVNIDIGVV